MKKILFVYFTQNRPQIGLCFSLSDGVTEHNTIAT